jgi:hypothetical protein
MSVRRACARGLGAVLLLAGFLLPRAASAVSAARAERPYDAPTLVPPDLRPGWRPTAPEVTPEYASIEEQGIKVVYHLLARERAHTLLARALAVRAELGVELGRDVLGAVEIRVAAMPAQMAALAPAEMPPGAPAAAFHELNLVVMSLGSPVPQDPADLEERLRHELVHVSGEDAAARAEALCVAALRDRLFGLRDVAARFPEGPPGGTVSIAGAEAADFVRFLGEPHQRQRFGVLIERLREGKPFEAALTAAYDGDLDQVERRFRQEMARRYSFLPVLGGATLLWVVVALLALVRRRRLAEQRSQAAAERRALGSAARLSTRDPPAPRPPIEEDDLAQAIPPDPEVPKVEHDGRWYTLH